MNHSKVDFLLENILVSLEMFNSMVDFSRQTLEMGMCKQIQRPRKCARGFFSQV